MPGPENPVDPNGLLEYSVVYTDRALNHMSLSFRAVMYDLSATLKEVYNADAVAIIPGSGTFGMEAVARQLATGKKCLVIRNGWFSYRWTQIFERGDIPASEIVLKARPLTTEANPAYVPPPIDELIKAIQSERPDVVFAAHVETSAGMILPDDYLRRVGEATRSVGGLFVLDCIASGAIWVDMQDTAVDVLISAPQKGWTGTPCAGLVMLNDRALSRVEASESTSFSCDLKKWLQIMRRYEAGAHAYHATMPTDGLRAFRDVMEEAKSYGFALLKSRQQELGTRIRALCATKWKSLAAPQFAAPSVVVCYTADINEHNGSTFAAHGIQIAAGVPLQCDEDSSFRTFRIGLFGLDKLMNLERTVERFKQVVDGL
jgi:aspartate aminotransferase-like enzyme